MSMVGIVCRERRAGTRARFCAFGFFRRCGIEFFLCLPYFGGITGAESIRQNTSVSTWLALKRGGHMLCLGVLRPSGLLKKPHMRRCAQSSRYNVPAKYASARRFFARLASESF